MNRIAFIFSSAPHGSSRGREGLDALLATSSVTKTEIVGVFFIGDGIFQILTKQKPSEVLARDYISTFKILSMYNIKDIFICITSMQERGVRTDIELVLNANLISAKKLREKLAYYEVVLTF